jgi:hypothetical protein
MTSFIHVFDCAVLFLSTVVFFGVCTIRTKPMWREILSRVPVFGFIAPKEAFRFSMIVDVGVMYGQS